MASLCTKILRGCEIFFSFHLKDADANVFWINSFSLSLSFSCDLASLQLTTTSKFQIQCYALQYSSNFFSEHWLWIIDIPFFSLYIISTLLLVWCGTMFYDRRVLCSFSETDRSSRKRTRIRTERNDFNDERRKAMPPDLNAQDIWDVFLAVAAPLSGASERKTTAQWLHSHGSESAFNDWRRNSGALLRCAHLLGRNSSKIMFSIISSSCLFFPMLMNIS